MTWTAIIFLIVIGVIALVLEIIVIPGFGVVGVLGFASIVFGVYESYSQYGAVAGNITLISTVFIITLLVVISLRTKTWRKLMLKTSIDSKVNEIDELNVFPGCEGVTTSRLAPGGKARINNELYEVSTQGLFVNENTEIIVVKVIKNRIIVKPKNE